MPWLLVRTPHLCQSESFSDAGASRTSPGTLPMPGYLRLTGRFQISKQDAEKVRQLRSQLIEILNGDPAASPTRRRAQTWCSLFVAPCAPEGTPPVSTRLRPCLGQGASQCARVGWVRSLAFLSILRD